MCSCALSLGEQRVSLAVWRRAGCPSGTSSALMPLHMLILAADYRRTVRVDTERCIVACCADLTRGTGDASILGNALVLDTCPGRARPSNGAVHILASWVSCTRRARHARPAGSPVTETIRIFVFGTQRLLGVGLSLRCVRTGGHNQSGTRGGECLHSGAEYVSVSEPSACGQTHQRRRQAGRTQPGPRLLCVPGTPSFCR